MAQLTLYVPNDVAAAVRKSARRARKSVSAYVVDLLPEARKRRPRKAKKALSAADVLKEAFGSWKGEFPAFPDEPPREPKK